MPGEYEEKFAGVRAFLGYMMSHPGKKLHFMGSEIGQFKEWDYKEGIEFFLQEYPLHKKLSVAVRELNELYKTTPALYEIEDSWDGFEWLAADDTDSNFLAYQRKDKNGETIVVLLNFSGSDLNGYRLGLPQGKYKVVYSSDRIRYGGSGRLKKHIFNTQRAYSHGKEYSIQFDLPKLTCVYLKKIY